MATKKSAKSPTFEKNLSDLETIVERMESGNQPLDKSLEDFERGMALAEKCEQSLKAAEQRVETLIAKEDKLSTEPFEPET